MAVYGSFLLKSIKPKTIEEFNKELNSYKYGIIVNGKIITNPSEKQFWDLYETLTPSEFEKYKTGVCYDYTAYEAHIFKSYFTKVQYKTYYLAFPCSNGDFSHTFLIFKDNNKWHWFESSWKTEKGIHEFNSEKEALDEITKKHFLINKKWITDNYKKFLKEYNPNNFTNMKFRDFLYKMIPDFDKYSK